MGEKEVMSDYHLEMRPGLRYRSNMKKKKKGGNSKSVSTGMTLRANKNCRDELEVGSMVSHLCITQTGFYLLLSDPPPRVPTSFRMRVFSARRLLGERSVGQD